MLELRCCVERSLLSQVKRRLWRASSVVAARSRWTIFTCACKLCDSGAYRPLPEPRECYTTASSHAASHQPPATSHQTPDKVRLTTCYASYDTYTHVQFRDSFVLQVVSSLLFSLIIAGCIQLLSSSFLTFFRFLCAFASTTSTNETEHGARSTEHEAQSDDA